jgi:hypothetical protein
MGRCFASQASNLNGAMSALDLFIADVARLAKIRHGRFTPGVQLHEASRHLREQIDSTRTTE